MRNALGAHTSARAQAPIEAAGCHPRFPPSSSPDFDPIEPMVAKIKAGLWAAAARSPDALLAATNTALGAAIPADAAGCYADCGFPLPLQRV